MPRLPQTSLVSLLAVALFASGLNAQSSSSGDARHKGSFVTIRNVAVKHGADGSAIEITSSVAVIPSITVMDGPPRLIIDLLGAIDAAAKQVNGAGGEITGVHITQYDENPPLTRITVDLAEPRTYVWEVVENRVLVHLKPLKDSPSRAARPSPQLSNPAPINANRAPAAMPGANANVIINRTPVNPNARNVPTQNPGMANQAGIRPGIQPVPNQPGMNQLGTSQAGVMQPGVNQTMPTAQPAIASQGIAPAGLPGATRGTVLLAGKSLVGDSAVTAGAETAILNLARGGQVSVCPGTTASVTTSKTGRDVMLGMSTGSLEVHYTLAASQDSVLTPDFRVLLQGPGTFHYAFSADAKGNTCVRTLPGNTAGAVIYELMGDGSYRVKPDEQVVFHSGQLNKPDRNIPVDCGRPQTQVPVMRVEGPSSAPPPLVAAAQPAPKPDVPAVAEQVNAVPMPVASSPAPAREPRKIPVQTGMPAAANNEARSMRASEVQIQVDAPLIYRAKDQGASGGGQVNATTNADVDDTHAPNHEAAGGAAPSPAADKAQSKPKKGFFGRVKHFIANVFG